MTSLIQSRLLHKKKRGAVLSQVFVYRLAAGLVHTGTASLADDKGWFTHWAPLGLGWVRSSSNCLQSCQAPGKNFSPAPHSKALVYVELSMRHGPTRLHPVVKSHCPNLCTHSVTNTQHKSQQSTSRLTHCRGGRTTSQPFPQRRKCRIVVTCWPESNLLLLRSEVNGLCTKWQRCPSHSHCTHSSMQILCENSMDTGLNTAMLPFTFHPNVHLSLFTGSMVNNQQH